MKVSKPMADWLRSKARPGYRDGDAPFVSLYAADAARLVREALKVSFPGVKFWVKSRSYSMGSAVDVYYDGGAGVGDIFAPGAKPPAGAPHVGAVQSVLDSLGGKHFDGYIDMEYWSESLLLPDGSLVYGGTDGTEGSRGSIPKEPVPAPEGAIRLRIGSWLHVSNGVPYESPAAVKAEAERHMVEADARGASLEVLR